MIKVGITGGIGSGKSIVSKAFALLNVPTYNADKRAKAIIRNDEKVKKEIVLLLGEKAYLENGDYNVPFVTERVFSDDKLLAELNAIVHPVVRQDAITWFRENENAAYGIYEAAIMNAAGNGNLLDFVIVVQADEKTRISRVLVRDSQRQKADIQEIMRKQKTSDAFVEIGDFIIQNNENDLVLEQVLKLHAKFS